jgi:hypothetical protein
MSYSEFSLAKVKKLFALNTSEKIDLFADIEKVNCGEYLKETLYYNTPLALASNSEKARSEMIITPILIQVRKYLNSEISLFSGVEFNINPEIGLNGYCDFIFSSAREQLFVSTPVIMLVEAKNEDIKGGIGQCIAEMVAAQIFNEQENNNISTVYGVVTSGTNWRFLMLKGKLAEIDLSEYYLDNIDQIFGILVYSINQTLKRKEQVILLD